MEQGTTSCLTVPWDWVSRDVYLHIGQCPVGGDQLITLDLPVCLC